MADLSNYLKLIHHKKDLKSLRLEYTQNQIIFAAINTFKTRSILKDTTINKSTIAEILHICRLIKFSTTPSNMNILNIDLNIQNIDFPERKFIKTNLIACLSKILRPKLELKNATTRNRQTIECLQAKLVASEQRLQTLQNKSIELKTKKLCLLNECSKLKYIQQKHRSEIENLSSQLSNAKAKFMKGLVKQQIFCGTPYSSSVINKVRGYIVSNGNTEKK